VCIDISTNQGRDTVGSLVWFEAGRPKKAEYRRFRIRGAPQDDFAAVHEVVTRYLGRRISEAKPLPDLVVIDGGKGQLGAAGDAGGDRGAPRVLDDARRTDSRAVATPAVTLPWSLECSACGRIRGAEGLPGVCDCGQPLLVRYPSAPPPGAQAHLRERPWTMWRYREWLPLADGESPVTLGEGGTPLLAVERVAARHGFGDLWVKDESGNPTGSFKARGQRARPR